MIKIPSKETYPRCEVWLSSHDMNTMTQLAYLRQELGIKRDKNLQQDSDLDLQTLPLYACKVPSVIFFPFVTYRCDTSFTAPANFIIPTTPWNRKDGKNWLNSLALPPAHLVNPQYSDSKYRLGWIEPNGEIKPENIYGHAEIISLATAAQSYFLDEIRYVYDENRSALDHRGNSKPSRYCFNERIADFDSTKKYLEWYISTFNEFFGRLLKIGYQEDKEKRTQYLVAGWTVNRLAIDMLTISLTDVPYVRKWQFFGFLDALANLINEFTIGKTSQQEDAKMFSKLLTLEYFQSIIKPELEKIPVQAIRDEIIAHAKTIYKSIEAMGTKIEIKGKNKLVSGQKLLRAYRNSRHGYALYEEEMKALIAHNGKIPDDLPDLGIVLWHYLLLKFPFPDTTK